LPLRFFKQAIFPQGEPFCAAKAVANFVASHHIESPRMADPPIREAVEFPGVYLFFDTML
jgi:hypothetical protein